MLNSDFELGWTRETFNGQEFGEIFVPEGWIAWWHEDDEFGRPEMQVINREPPYLDPPRIYHGQRALKYFTFYRRLRGGIMQKVAVEPGHRYRLSAFAHAWYSQLDDPHRSEYRDEQTGEWMQIHDGDPGMKLFIGVSPFDLFPFDALDIQTTAFFYDAYDRIELEFTPHTYAVWIVLGAESEYPFKHCDVYWDLVSLEDLGAEVNEPPEGSPRVPYTRVYVLMPPDADSAWTKRAVDATWDKYRFTVGGSADDAGFYYGLASTTVLAVNPDRWDGDLRGFFSKFYPKAIFTPINANSPDDLYYRLKQWLGEYEPDEPPDEGPPPDPPVVPEPPEPPEPPDAPPPDLLEPFVPRGTLGGYHGSMGDMGQIDLFKKIAERGGIVNTAKLVQSLGAAGELKQIMPLVKIIGRFIDDPQLGNLEWFNHNLDPIWQAETRMNAVLRKVEPYAEHIDYLEIVNEQDPPTVDGHMRLADFFVRAMTIAEKHGLHLAIFSYSMGVPEPYEWDAIASTGVFECAAQGGHAIALHEYGLMGQEHLIGRFRDLYTRILIPRCLRIPLYITEYGVPRDFLHQGTDAVWQQFVGYDRLVSRYPYVAGFHAYVGPVGDPDYYNGYIATYPLFEEYAVNTSDRINPTTE